MRSSSSAKLTAWCRRRYTEVGVTYGGVRQRWLVVYSQAAYKRDVKALEKRIAKEREQAERTMKGLARQEFISQEAVEQASRRWKYHTLQVRYTKK